MPDFHYENKRLAEIYDLDSPWSVDRDFYLSLAGEACQDVLDLGCGTGLLCNAYAAKGHKVTGVDPSLAMLDVGRKNQPGKDVEWVQACAQDYQSEKRFDLIIMTGHAFQVLLSDQDILDAFSVIRKHLKAGGRVVFESRNPAIDWAKDWNREMTFELPEGNVHEARRLIAMKDGLMSFEHHYQFPDEALVSKSELRFLSRNDIEERLAASGLRVQNVFGDWDSSAFNEETSHEMIFVAG